jgi:hypothetical protein
MLTDPVDCGYGSAVGSEQQQADVSCLLKSAAACTPAAGTLVTVRESQEDDVSVRKFIVLGDCRVVILTLDSSGAFEDVCGGLERSEDDLLLLGADCGEHAKYEGDLCE